MYHLYYKMAVLLQDNPNRFVLFPIQYDNLWQFYKKAEGSFWTAEEIDMNDDAADWDSLKPSEQDFILKILGFFAASDGIVIENLLSRFASEVQLPEARCFYSFQAAIENIHSEVYSLMITKFAGSEKKQNELFRAIETHRATKAKADWAIKIHDPERKPKNYGRESALVRRMVPRLRVRGGNHVLQLVLCAVLAEEQRQVPWAHVLQ